MIIWHSGISIHTTGLFTILQITAEKAHLVQAIQELH